MCRRKEYESIRHMEGSVQLLRIGPSCGDDMATAVDAAVRTVLFEALSGSWVQLPHLLNFTTGTGLQG